MSAAGGEAHGAPGFKLARPLFGTGIAVAATDPRATHHQALPQESAALPGAAPRRQRTFAAGRVAAHAAMAELNEPVRPVLMGPDRAPVWPKGLVGSISHSQTCCIAAIGRSDRVKTLGVDVEEDEPLDGDLIPTVCTIAEMAWLSTCPRAQAGRMAKLIFSAKECAYKCQYPLTGALIGFETFEVTPDPDTGQFEATFAQDVAPFAAGTRLYGRFAIGAGLIVTAMTLAA